MQTSPHFLEQVGPVLKPPWGTAEREPTQCLACREWHCSEQVLVFSFIRGYKHKLLCRPDVGLE